MLKQMSVRRVSIGVVVLLALGVLSAGCASLGSTTAQGSGSSEPVISVTGYGEVKGKPDMAVVQLGVNVMDSSVDDAVTEANAVSERIKQAVLALGVEDEDIQTTNYNVWPEDRYDPQTGSPTGERFFHVDSTIMVTIYELSSLGQILASSLEAGANNVYGASFGLADSDPMAAEARLEAIGDAHQRASQIAQELGVQLGEPIAVSEGSSFVSYTAYGYGFEQAQGIGGGGAPPISPGQTTVSAQIQVTYLIER